MERFRYKATKARQVQSRLRMLEKMEVAAPEENEGGIRFDFPPPPASGRVLLELDEVTKLYGSLPVFRGVTLRIERGERIAVLGANGKGKSTLARIIAGLEGFQQGERKTGQGVAIGYYAQDQAEILDPGKTVLRTLEEVAADIGQNRLRSLLGCFLFEGDDAFKPVSVLSGGEKSRLALARMLLIPSNLLVLDEPTNHLDVRSKEVLQEALSNYAGSYLIVSHDRDFLAPLVDKVLDFKDGGLRVTLGNVEDYLQKWHREQQSETELKSAKEEAGKKGQNNGREQKREQAERRQELYRKLKPLRVELDSIEGGITAAEQRKSEIEAALAEPRPIKRTERSGARL